MDYIEGRTRSDGCVFCELASLQPSEMRAGLVLLATPLVFVCLNRYPFTTSHLLVMPRRHVADLTELRDDEHAALFDMVRASTVRLRKATNAEALNVGINLGKAAGAGIAEHLHVHIVPRWSGDTNFMPVIADVRVMPEYLDQAWARLYACFADVPGERAPAP